MNKFTRAQNGNVLFIILIAVALFAALSYAMTSSGRTNDGQISKTKADIAAAQILQLMSDIEKGVERVRMANGCKDTEINFHTPVYKLRLSDNPLIGANHNPNAPSDESCNVFSPNGGGVIPILIDGIAIDNQVSGGWRTGHGGGRVGAVKNVGSSENDLLWAFPHIKIEVCEAIHRRMGLPETIIDDPLSTWLRYDGTYTGVTGVFGDTNPAIAGQHSFCVLDLANENSSFFHNVLIAR